MQANTAALQTAGKNGWNERNIAKLNVESRRAKEEAEFTEWVGKEVPYQEIWRRLDKINYAVKIGQRLLSYTTLAESVGRIEICPLHPWSTASIPLLCNRSGKRIRQYA